MEIDTVLELCGLFCAVFAIIYNNKMENAKLRTTIDFVRKDMAKVEHEVSNAINILADHTTILAVHSEALKREGLVN